MPVGSIFNTLSQASRLLQSFRPPPKPAKPVKKEKPKEPAVKVSQLIKSLNSPLAAKGIGSNMFDKTQPIKLAKEVIRTAKAQIEKSLEKSREPWRLATKVTTSKPGSKERAEAIKQSVATLDPFAVLGPTNVIKTGIKKEYEPVVKFLKGKLTKEDVNLLDEFSDAVSMAGKGANRKNLGPIGDQVQTFLNATFGKKSGTWSNTKAKDAIQYVLKRLGETDKRSIGLATSDVSDNFASGVGRTGRVLDQTGIDETIQAGPRLPQGTPQGLTQPLSHTQGTVPNVPSGPGIPSGGSIPPANDPVKKIIEALKTAKPIRGQQEYLYTKARGEKIARAAAVGERVPGEQGFFGQLGQLKGSLPKAEYESVRPKLDQGDIDTLFNQVRNNPTIDAWDQISAQTGLAKILSKEGGGVPTKSEIKLLNKVFGKEFTETVLSKRGNMDKFMDVAGEALNLPRSLMASMDLSAPLRQGLPLIGRKEWWKSFASMFKQAGSEKAFRAVQDDIARKPTYPLMKQYKLALTDLDEFMSGREEAVMSTLAERIPGVGKLVRGSNRAYTGFLNKLRADTFDTLVNNAQKSGAINDPKFLPSLTSFINNATGRGGLGKLENAATVLNGVFFSPRLMASRVSLLNPGAYVRMQPEVRKEAIKSMLSMGAIASTVLGLAKLGGADIVTDPRNADFGKIKVGNTRYDILGGFQQYLRVASQVSTGKIISSTTGKELTLGEGYRPLTKKDVAQRFLEGKLAPVPQMIGDFLRGESLIGEPLDYANKDPFKNPVTKSFIPIFLQDVKDAIEEEGPLGAARAIPSVFGASSMTYGGTPVSRVEAEQSGSVGTYKWLKTLKKEERNKYIDEVTETKPETISKLEKFKALEDQGLGEPEWRMIGSGIKNGDRSQMIMRELNKKKTKQEFNDYIDKLVESEILTDVVEEQLAKLKKQGKLKIPSEKETPKPGIIFQKGSTSF